MSIKSLEDITALFNSKNMPEAEASIRAYVNVHPNDINGLILYTRIFYERMQYAHALEAAQKVLKIAPAHADAIVFAVRCCAQLGLLQLGCDLIKELNLAFNAEQQSYYGMLYMELAAHDLALSAFEKALASFPNDLTVQYRYGEALLAAGHYDRGMPLYGIEFSRAYLEKNPHLYPSGQLKLEQYWQGEDLTGKNFFIGIYGGVGDYVQFVRYAKCLKALGAARVLAYSPNPRINGLLSSLPEIEVINVIDPSLIDWWGHSHSLCFQLQPKFGFMSQDAYLSPPVSELANQFLSQVRQRANGKQCIGLSWHSDSFGAGWRNVALPHLLPLFSMPNVHWVIMQRGFALQEFIESGLDANCSILTEQATFDDTAAVIKGLDGVVTIESFMYHIAGSIGQKTYLMVGRALDWRHMNEETHSVWYKSVQLVRQPALGDWRSVVQNIKALLQ